MIRFFKSGFIVQYAAIFITGLLLWGNSFFAPPVMPYPEGCVPFYSLLYTLLSGVPVVQVIIGFLLLFVSTFILNTLLSRHGIVQKNTSMAGFIFMILMSSYPAFQTIHPAGIAVFFLLLILDQLLRAYNKEEPLDLIYSSGFLVATGSWFYFPFLFFFGLILVSFILFRFVRWREWVSSMFGFLTPFLFIGTYYFWFDRLTLKVNEYLGMLVLYGSLLPLKSTVFVVLTLLIIIVSLFAMFYGATNRIEKTIERKRKSLLLNWILFFLLVSFPFTSNLSGYHIELAFVTFSGAIAFYLVQIRKPFRQEIALLLFILFILANNLFLHLS